MQLDRKGKSGFFTLLLDTELELPPKYWKPFIDEMKDLIPWADRDYDPKTQVWTISDTYYQTVIGLRKKHFEKDQMSLFGERQC
jgi:hypothetical protein